MANESSVRSSRKRITLLVALSAFAVLGALAVYASPASELNRHTIAQLILLYLLCWGAAFLWSDAPRAEQGIRFLLATGSIAVIVGMLELSVAAHLVDFRLVFNTIPREPWYHPDNALDPQLLYVHRPHSSLVWEGVEYRYDSHGLRNETELESADVIVIGDSFVEGWGVPADELLTAHLARRLDRRVANLGQSWYGPQQELEMLRRFGLPLRPSTCVWVFYEGNDLYDAQRYRTARQDWDVFSKKVHTFTERSFTKNAILSMQRLREQVRKAGDDKQWYEERSGIFRTPDRGPMRIYFPEPGLPLDNADEEALHHVRVSLRQAQESCGGIGARLLVVFAPKKFRVYKEFTEFDDAAVPRGWVMNDLPQRLEAIVLGDIPDARFLDLTPAFRGHAQNGSLLYFAGWDTHWSPEGHRVAADAIAEAIRRWDVPGYTVRYEDTGGSRD